MSYYEDISCTIFSLEGAELKPRVYIVDDHVNLSGSGLEQGKFTPVQDLYTYTRKEEELSNNRLIAGSVKVACLKDGVIPSSEEAKILLEQGIEAFSYDLFEKVIRVAERGNTARAVAYLAKVPKGFKLGGVAAGLKADPSTLDLGLIETNGSYAWTGMFTQNAARASSVITNENMQSELLPTKAIICNSGNANACTGLEGQANDQKLRQLAANKLGLQTEEVLSASTGKIGVQLDIETISKGINKLSLGNSSKDIIKFAQAILTTDTYSKIAIDYHDYSDSCVLGIAKGSGMIHPNMATMLGFILTDFRLLSCGDDIEATQQTMRGYLNEAVRESFNCISVDGDTSTNDMVLCVTSMQGELISDVEFLDYVSTVCRKLAKQIVMDAEGATKLIKLALTDDFARTYNIDHHDIDKVGKSILRSQLVKTAMFGNDPNWGRIIAALGQGLSEHSKLSTEVQQQIINNCYITLAGKLVYAAGLPTAYIQNPQTREELSQKMCQSREIDIHIAFSEEDVRGLEVLASNYEYLGSDLSYKYVEINAEYFT